MSCIVNDAAGRRGQGLRVVWTGSVGMPDISVGAQSAASNTTLLGTGAVTQLL